MIPSVKYLNLKELVNESNVFHVASISLSPFGPADFHDHDLVAAPSKAPPRPLHQDIALTGSLSPTVLHVQIDLKQKDEPPFQIRIMVHLFGLMAQPPPSFLTNVGESKESSNCQFGEQTRTTDIVQTEKAKSKQFIQLFCERSVSQSA